MGIWVPGQPDPVPVDVSEAFAAAFVSRPTRPYARGAVGAAYLPAAQRPATGHDRRRRRRPGGPRRVHRRPGRPERLGQVDPPGGAGRSGRRPSAGTVELAPDPPRGQLRSLSGANKDRSWPLGRRRAATRCRRARAVPAVIAGPRAGRGLGTAAGGQHHRAAYGSRRGPRHLARRRGRPGYWRGPGPTCCWTGWAWPTSRRPTRASCPVGNNDGSPWRRRSSTSRRSSSPTSRPSARTGSPGRPWSGSSTPCGGPVRPWSWPRTTTPWWLGPMRS